VLTSIILALVLTLALDASNKIAFPTHHYYLATTYIGGKNVALVLDYTLECFVSWSTPE